MQVWDRADGDALARERGKLAVVREIGQALIAFLAAIEDVQAALFEKRKFVLRNDCLVRVSALDANHKSVQTLIDQARSNGAQVGEWVEWLGEKPLSRSASAKAIEKRGAELLAAYRTCASIPSTSTKATSTVCWLSSRIWKPPPVAS